MNLTASTHLGFTLGQMSTNSILRLNEKGDWIEDAELIIGTPQLASEWLAVKQHLQFKLER